MTAANQLSTPILNKSGLLFYYRKLLGSITDVKTIKQMMNDFDVLGIKELISSLTTDSSANVDEIGCSIRRTDRY